MQTKDELKKELEVTKQMIGVLVDKVGNLQGLISLKEVNDLNNDIGKEIYEAVK